MGDEDEGSAVFDDFFHALHALELKLRVANREHFVDDQDFRLEECSNRECQPHIHPARIAFNGRVDKLFETSESHNVIKLSFYFSAVHAEDGAIEKDVVPASKLGMKTCPHFE